MPSNNELDEILEKFNPFNISYTDFQRLKPEAKVAILAYIAKVVRKAEKKGWDDCALYISTVYQTLSAQEFKDSMKKTWDELQAQSKRGGDDE